MQDDVNIIAALLSETKIIKTTFSIIGNLKSRRIKLYDNSSNDDDYQIVDYSAVNAQANRSRSLSFRMSDDVVNSCIQNLTGADLNKKEMYSSIFISDQYAKLEGSQYDPIHREIQRRLKTRLTTCGLKGMSFCIHVFSI